MPIRCAWFRLTFFPAAYPSADDGVVLVDDDTELDESSPLVGKVSQLLQRANFVEGAVPDFYVRGNRSASLDWEEVRRNINPPVATGAALDAMAAMPDTTGYILLEIPDLGRQWIFTPAAVESAGWDHEPHERRLRLRWRIPVGPPEEIAAVLSDDTLLTEIGTDFLLEDDSGSILLETA